MAVETTWICVLACVHAACRHVLMALHGRAHNHTITWCMHVWIALIKF